MANEDDPEETLKKLKERADEIAVELTPREREVLRQRFGVDLNSDATLAEVGRQFDETRRRIRELERRARKERGLPDPPDETE